MKHNPVFDISDNAHSKKQIDKRKETMYTMGKTLYFECYSGISGDMTVAALLDLGADRNVLQQVLKSLPIDGFSIKISRVSKAGLDACDFHVMLDQENHDHDMEYLHDQSHMHHPHVHEHGQSSIQTSAMTAHHQHRNLADILSIIHQADMTENAKQIASKIFHILGNAEAKAHGTDVQHVHFHEVGAIDSIIDIISTAVCLDNLGITDVIIPVLYEGCGTIQCQHGILPIPVPATANIIAEHKLTLHLTQTHGEFVTPTGAAIAAATCTASKLPEHFHILSTGLGAGKRTYDRPSILRAMRIQPCDHNQIKNVKPIDTDIIYKLETNIDDCSGEVMGYVLDCLMEAGALDVHYFPTYMKKNRPAYQLNVICRQGDIPDLEQIIFRQTTTIGIRRQCMERTALPRRVENVQTEYGEVQVKLCEMENGLRIYPEYSSILQVCKKTGKPYIEVYTMLQNLCRKQLF